MTKGADYNHQEAERTWRQVWREHKTHQPDLEKAERPFYNLMMFPYPSAEGLHVGNMYAFTGADVYGRYQRMKGHDVFEPIGLDGFGIHSENYAIKVGKHPREQAAVSQKRFYEQLATIGAGYAWDYRLETYDPEYYKWTQWLFGEMFKRGLAYRKKARVNWCPSCKTVLADEQVIDGRCERCKHETGFKELAQWFFRITAYADELLAEIDNLKWPEKIKTTQRNWIGKSEGVKERWQVKGLDLHLETFTTWPHTTWGATFVVIAPEHPVIQELMKGSDKEREVLDYCEALVLEKQRNKLNADKEKHGIDTGRVVINPLTGWEMPVWVANFAVMDYGTGIVKGCPAHDERDFEFARKYALPIKTVIDSGQKDQGELYVGPGTMVNAGEFTGMKTEEAKEAITKRAVEMGYGERMTDYHLRDWLISRQRYWGPPIPMIFCPACSAQGKSWENSKLKTLNSKQNKSNQDTSFNNMAGWYPVELPDLPVELPDLKDWQPKGDGRGPLENADESWLFTKCPGCGGQARRETDVSDTFLDSAWYFLAYPNLKTQAWLRGRTSTQAEGSDLIVPWDMEITKKWLPVNAYIGGAEHAVLHLLYSRFVWKFLRDAGYLPFSSREIPSPSGSPHSARIGRDDSTDLQSVSVESSNAEPFPFLYGHGLIIKDGAKMSKSRGNVVVPDEYIETYGADALRMYLMFIGPYDQGGDFRDTGMKGMANFLKRLWNLMMTQVGGETSADVAHVLQTTIAKMDRDYANFRFNTAISVLMEFCNAWKQDQQQLSLSDALTVVKLVAPLAPFMAEEMWQKLTRDQKPIRQAQGKPETRNQKTEILRQTQDETRDQQTHFKSVHGEAFPTVDEAAIQNKPVTVVVMVNGKVRHSLQLTADSSQLTEEQMVEMAKAEPKVAKWLVGKEVRKVIWVAPASAEGSSEARQGVLNLVVG